MLLKWLMWLKICVRLEERGSEREREREREIASESESESEEAPELNRYSIN